MTEPRKATMEVASNPTEEQAAQEQLQIDDQRKLDTFQTKYKELVQETGMYLVIDLSSSLSDLKLGIAKLPQQDEQKDV